MPDRASSKHDEVHADTSWQQQPNAPQRGAYEQAEVRIAVAKSDAGQLTPQQVADGIQQQIVKAIDQLVRQDADLCGKKGVYMKFGCRGKPHTLQQWTRDVSIGQGFAEYLRFVLHTRMVAQVLVQLQNLTKQAVHLINNSRNACFVRYV